MTTRLVPITEEQRRLLRNPELPLDRAAVMNEIIAAFDAAPGDPEAAIRQALNSNPVLTRDQAVQAVLRALHADTT